jgi:hypothetical protein
MSDVSGDVTEGLHRVDASDAEVQLCYHGISCQRGGIQNTAVLTGCKAGAINACIYANIVLGSAQMT